MEKQRGRGKLECEGGGGKNWRGDVVGGYAAQSGMKAKERLARSTRREVSVCNTGSKELAGEVRYGCSESGGFGDSAG